MIWVGWNMNGGRREMHSYIWLPRLSLMPTSMPPTLFLLFLLFLLGQELLKWWCACIGPPTFPDFEHLCQYIEYSFDHLCLYIAYFFQWFFQWHFAYILGQLGDILYFFVFLFLPFPLFLLFLLFLVGLNFFLFFLLVSSYRSVPPDFLRSFFFILRSTKLARWWVGSTI